MPLASTVVSSSNLPTTLGQGNSQGVSISIGPADAIGAFGVTPVVQSALAPTAQGSGTGGVGSSTYTLGDVVFALKTLGFIPL